MLGWPTRRLYVYNCIHCTLQKETHVHVRWYKHTNIIQHAKVKLNSSPTGSEWTCIDVPGYQKCRLFCLKASKGEWCRPTLICFPSGLFCEIQFAQRDKLSNDFQSLNSSNGVKLKVVKNQKTNAWHPSGTQFTPQLVLLQATFTCTWIFDDVTQLIMQMKLASTKKCAFSPYWQQYHVQ